MFSGRLQIGLDDSQLELLANADDVKKLSVRDLAVAVAKQWNGATTVATTMWVAHRAESTCLRREELACASWPSL